MTRGFTIVEIAISILILSLAITAIFNAFSVVSLIASDATDRTVAIYLAQEGMELVRNMRDQNWLEMDACDNDPSCSSSWDYGLEPCINNDGCIIDYRIGGASRYNVNYPEHLKMDNDSGFYGYFTAGSYSETKFVRRIRVERLPDVGQEEDEGDHILKVEAEVSWDIKPTLLSPARPAGNCNTKYNCVTVKEVLYNWYNYEKPSS